MSGMLEALSKYIKQFIQLWKTKAVSPVFSKLSTRLLFTLTMIDAARRGAGLADPTVTRILSASI